MNTTRTSIAEDLRQVVGSENVLNDIEDLHVYSHEQLFRKPRYLELKIIVRTSSNKQAQQVMKIARKESFTVIRRSTGKVEVLGSARYPTVLLDDAVPSKLEIPREPEEKEVVAERARELSRAGHGTFRNFALALEALFMKVPASKCLECATCSGYCTVTQSFNGVETWSSKGRTLLIRGFSSGRL
ncbi:MAG: hypothetical protein ACETV1_09070, partial [Candidatus Bathyarchaeia archaeon]